MKKRITNNTKKALGFCFEDGKNVVFLPGETKSVQDKDLRELNANPRFCKRVRQGDLTIA